MITERSPKGPPVSQTTLFLIFTVEWSSGISSGNPASTVTSASLPVDSEASGPRVAGQES